MLPLLLGCARVAPLPAVSSAPASSFTTDPASLADADLQLYSTIAETLGDARPDEACDRMAQQLLVRALHTGETPQPEEVEELAQAQGMPLPVRTWFVGQDWPKWLVRRMFVALLQGQGDTPAAFGFATWGRGSQTSAAIVIADDVMHLAAPFPKVALDASPLTLKWDEAGTPQVESVGPDGSVLTALTVADGQAHAVLPAPGATGVRHDLVRVEAHATHDESTLLGSFDQPASDGSLPGAPPLADGATPQERVLATLQAMRSERGSAPLTLVGGAAGCDDWPAEVEGTWVTGGQKCWEDHSGDWEAAWRRNAARPYFQRAVRSDGFDLVDVETDGGLTIHLLRRFERLEPVAAADKVAALLLEKFPGVVRIPSSDPAFLQAQAAAIAADDNQHDTSMEAVTARQDLMGDDVMQVMVHSLAAPSLEGIASLVEQDFVPTRFAVALDVGHGSDGFPNHYAIVVVAR